MKRAFEGDIHWLKSIETGREFPNLVFRADVDFATTGMVSLTSIEKPEIVAAMMTTAEYEGADGGNGYAECAARINSELGRHDLRIPELLRVEETFSAPKGISFQEFQKVYRPPKLFYSDIFSDGGDAEVIREESIDAFLAAGGTLIDWMTND